MLEIPEAAVLARQMNTSLAGKSIERVSAASSPHKFAWYHGDPADYPVRLAQNSIVSASPTGGMVELKLTRSTLLFTDGVNLRFLKSVLEAPQKHQLLLEFSDGSALSASVQMYGGLSCWMNDEIFENPYYQVAREKPSPLEESFNEQYFEKLISTEDVRTLSLKAALATQQRIPGLGNGALQDILWKAKLHPRRKVNTLTPDEYHALFSSLKMTLAEMTQLGGRDTEKDLYGNAGGYPVVMSSKNNAAPCPLCGTPIVKEAYLGGSIYFCRQCQRL